MGLRALLDRARTNLMVYVAPSTIHGLGLFANVPISRGTYIGRYSGTRTKENDTYVLWLEDGDGGMFGIDGDCDLRFANHSSKPNARMDSEGRLFADADIPAGEEITWHYGDEWDGVP